MRLCSSGTLASPHSCYVTIPSSSDSEVATLLTGDYDGDSIKFRSTGGCWVKVKGANELELTRVLPFLLSQLVTALQWEPGDAMNSN